MCIRDSPYAAPVKSYAPENQDYANPAYSPFVWQVQIAGIVMVIQGVLELLFGMYLMFLFFVLPGFMGAPSGTSNPAQQQQMIDIITYYMGIGGPVLMLLGIARIAAGILGIQYRARVFGIVINCIGLLSIISFYCLPTALVVCIYTCIIYFNRATVQAFAMKANGSKIGQIHAHFSS